MLARLLVVSVLLAPLAAAVIPVIPAVDSVPIVSHYMQDYATQTTCYSSDPALNVVNTDLTSRLTPIANGDGTTTYAIHLDATLADPAFGTSAACGALDLEFTSTLSWPPPANSPQAYGPVQGACGLTGAMLVYNTPGQDYVQFYLHGGGAGCGLAITSGFIDLTVQSLHPSTALVCSPAVVAGCSGAYSGHWDQPGCAVGYTFFGVGAMGFDLVSASHQCNWQDGREHAYVADTFGIVVLDATSDSCEVRISDPFGVAPQGSAACPEEVRALVYDQDWQAVLP